MFMFNVNRNTKLSSIFWTGNLKPCVRTQDNDRHPTKSSSSQVGNISTVGELLWRTIDGTIATIDG